MERLAHILALVTLVATLAPAGGSPPAKGFYAFTMKSIDGKPVPLKRMKGKVALVVNVATFCGNTPQYAGLETVFEKYRKRGFTVLGFPANEFGAQEPGTNADIKSFCTSKYDVKFPMFSKIVVKGPEKNPLYAWLIENSDRHDEIEWNFAKFLIGRDGHVVKRFSPKTKPESPEVIAAIESALAAK
ncbi:MAG: glutathione peroxidase [Fimbriimonas ginsengisoli]|uniref:Glutathione peroxidase n=1 Tax=Fimbriimonas ginsengisoli TaxID=1005039 RepID=A0A931LVB9_FIMGI|nr:glutathione peroxidase [Fimbriimonas ginsengisoli]MBI3721982.1 glutathione peroxidase [Fimbriimonas ginsengisoli]